MELFAIMLTGPVAFVVSAAYCSFLRRFVTRFAWLSTWLVYPSCAVLAAFGIELALLMTMGVGRSRAAIGPGFYLVHSALFFLGTPALAQVLVLSRRSGVLGKWYVAAALCSAFAVVLVFMQYVVSEALYGINGSDGPYS